MSPGKSKTAKAKRRRPEKQKSLNPWSKHANWTHVLLVGASITLALAVAKQLGAASGTLYSIVLVTSATITTFSYLVTTVLADRPFKEAIFPVVTAFALTGVIVALLLAAAPEGPGPDRMTGDFNIAVAEFGAIGSSSETAEAARALSDSVHRFLTDEAVQLRTQSNDDIQIYSPEDTGQISGDNREDRAASARLLASAIQADLIVYGTLTVERGVTTFSPEFVLTDRRLRGAEELLGHYELGDPVVTSGGVLDSQKPIRDEIEARTIAFARFVIGLTYYRAGDYRQATDYFSQALTMTSASGELAWREEDGIEVLYLFLGNAAGREGELVDATSHYQTALEVSDDEFARAYVGLGEVSRVGARCAGSVEAVDPILLEEAWDSYEASLVAAIQPAVSEIAAKTAYGRGMIQLCRGRADAAEKEFTSVINAYLAPEDDPNERITELAAEAYMGLGLASVYQDDGVNLSFAYSNAIGHYESASLIHTDRTRLALIHGWLGWLYGQSDEIADDEKSGENCVLAVELGLEEATYAALCSGN